MIRALLASLVWVVLCTAAADGAKPPANEEDIKAALLVNFAKFVTWPDAPSQPFVFAVIGDERLARTLRATTAGAAMGGQAVAVRVLDPSDSLDGIRVLFVDVSEPRVADVLRRSPPGVLTVGETSEFLKNGGMLRVFRDGDHFRFEIDAANVRRGGVRMHSQLLSLGAAPSSD